MTDKLDTKEIRAQYSDGEYLDAYPGEACATILALCDALDGLRAENERLRNFIVDFSETKFDRIDRRSLDPQDDLDPLTDCLAIEAWQEDARAALLRHGDDDDE